MAALRATLGTGLPGPTLAAATVAAGPAEAGEEAVNIRPEDLPSKTLRPPSPEGYYPRCVHCGGENYVLSALAYSCRVSPCAAVPSCGQFLPQSYLAYPGETKP